MENPNIAKDHPNASNPDEVNQSTEEHKDSTSSTLITDPQLNSALGSVIGAFIGDSLGSAVEFQRSVSEADLARALRMEGGIFGNGPGQVTDDSELAMCLLKGICDSLPIFNDNHIAKYYRDWINSRPFDIGTTTRAALESLIEKKNFEVFAQTARKAANKYNQKSLSNGSFMRSSPLAVFCRNLNPQETRKIVEADSSLTHSNSIIHETETLYILCISHLIQNPRDKDGAIQKAWEYSESCGEQAKEWLNDAFNDSKAMPGNPNMGFVKIAFDHSFRELRKGNINFVETMRRVLNLGGDTDTNACIVGAMIGAYVGYNELPQEWKEKVENFGEGVGGIKRPEFLNQRIVKGMVERIFREAPSKLDS